MACACACGCAQPANEIDLADAVVILRSIGDLGEELPPVRPPPTPSSFGEAPNTPSFTGKLPLEPTMVRGKSERGLNTAGNEEDVEFRPHYFDPSWSLPSRVTHEEDSEGLLHVELPSISIRREGQ